MGRSQDTRRHVALVVRADGRRVQMPIADSGLLGLSFSELLSSLVVEVLGLVGLITGSRRENGGSGRDERH
jgi:hypothetical protein